MRGLKIHVLHCGYIQVSDTVPFGNDIDLKNTGLQLLTPAGKRLTLPVCVYLAEHPKGLLLFDTGWCRDISPEGVYDDKAVRRVLPGHLAAFYHPWLPAGMAVHEQLAAMGVRPQDLEYVILRMSISGPAAQCIRRGSPEISGSTIPLSGASTAALPSGPTAGP